MAVLAAAALANVTACFSHPHPSSLTTLLWHGATVGALVAAAALAGPWMFPWPARRRSV
jgi:hypothetical protein